MGEEQEGNNTNSFDQFSSLLQHSQQEEKQQEDLIHILATQIHMMVVSIKILANLFMIYLKNKEDLKTRP